MANPFVEQKQEESSFSDYLIAIPEILTTGVSSFAASAPATIGGAIAAGAEAVRGGDPLQAYQDVYEETVDTLTYEPKTEASQRVMQDLQPVAEAIEKGGLALSDMGGAMGGPTGAAVAVTLPHAVLEFLGAGLIKRGVNLRNTKTLDRVSRNMKDEGLMDDAGNLTEKGQEVLYAQSKEVASELEGSSDPKDIKLAAKAASGKDKAVEIAQIDDRIMQSARDLGVDMPVSSASQNRSFVEAAQAAKSQPGSRLSAQEALAIKQTTDAADGFIARLRNGDLDITGVDQALVDIFNRHIDGLSVAAEDGYKIVERAIAKTEALDDVSILREYVDNALADVGGDIKELRPIEKRIYGLVNKFDNSEYPVTYGLIDKVRKEIGKGYKRKGQFADEDSVALDAVYSALSRQQKQFIGSKSPQLLDAYESAATNAAKYKGLQSTMQDVLGKNLNKSIVPQIRASVNNMRKGNIRPYQQMMENVPKEFRGEVAAVSLKELFELGSRTNAGLSEGFVKTWQALNRNKNAKRLLLKDLPPEAAKFVDDVGRVWTGLIRSKALQNNSKTARDILAALDNGQMIRKVAGVAPAAAAASVDPTGASLLAGIAMITKRGKSTAEKIDNFITSNAFSRAVKLAANGKQDIAHKILNNSYTYKKWLRTLPKAEQRAIQATGFIPWITTPVGSAMMIAGAQDGD